MSDASSKAIDSVLAVAEEAVNEAGKQLAMARQWGETTTSLMRFLTDRILALSLDVDEDYPYMLGKRDAFKEVAERLTNELRDRGLVE